MGRKKSHGSQSTGKMCPDPRVCQSCADSTGCQYLQSRQQSKFLDELLKLLRRRIDIGGGECLVNIRNISRILAKKTNVRPHKLTKLIDEVLITLKTEKWGHATSEYRTKKWNVRPISSKIYQINQVTVASLEWYIDKTKDSGRVA